MLGEWDAKRKVRFAPSRDIEDRATILIDRESFVSQPHFLEGLEHVQTSYEKLAAQKIVANTPESAIRQKNRFRRKLAPRLMLGLLYIGLLYMHELLIEVKMWCSNLMRSLTDNQKMVSFDYA